MAKLSALFLKRGDILIELKFYRDDEYVYINNPDGTTKKVPIEDFESAISGDGGDGGSEIAPTRPVVYNSFQNKLFFSDTYEDVTYDELNIATATNQIVNLRWIKPGVGTLNGYLAKLANAANNYEAYFIIIDDNNIPTVIKFNATGGDTPLKVNN